MIKGTRLPLSFFASSTFRGSAAAPLRRRLRGAVVMSVGLVGLICLRAQEPDAAGQRAGRVRDFLAQRVGERGSAAAALQRARAQHLGTSRMSKAFGLGHGPGGLLHSFQSHRMRVC